MADCVSWVPKANFVGLNEPMGLMNVLMKWSAFVCRWPTSSPSSFIIVSSDICYVWMFYSLNQIAFVRLVRTGRLSLWKLTIICEKCQCSGQNVITELSTVCYLPPSGKGEIILLTPLYSCLSSFIGGFPMKAQLVKNSPAWRDTLVQFLGQEDPLEKG